MTQASTGLGIAIAVLGLWACAGAGAGAGDRATRPAGQLGAEESPRAPLSDERRLLMRMWDGTEIGSGGTVREGELFELVVRLDSPAYVYVVQFYERSSAVLYPPPGQERAAGPGLIRLPSEPQQWWHVVGSPGQETLYVVISGAPMSRVDEYIAGVLDTVQRSPGAPAGSRDERPTSAGAETSTAARRPAPEPAPGLEDTPRPSAPKPGGKSRAREARAAKGDSGTVPRAPASAADPPSHGAGAAGRDDFPGDTSVLTRAVQITTAYSVDAESAERAVAILHVTFVHRSRSQR